MVPNSGTIDPGGSETVHLEVFSANYDWGENLLNLVVDSNDPENSSLIVPITFTTEPGELIHSPGSVDLDLYVNEQGTQEIVSLFNNGIFKKI